MASSGAVDVVVVDGITSVTVAGEFDLGLSEEFAAATSRGVGPVEVDLAEVSFIDSSGISALLRAVSALEVQGRALRVVHPTEMARQVLAICGVEEYLDMVDPLPSPSGPALPPPMTNR